MRNVMRNPQAGAFIDGIEFARRWDSGEFLNRDEPGVMQVAILRPHGWPVTADHEPPT